VTGQIVAIPVRANVPVKTGDFFPIDPAPLQYKVAQRQPSLTSAGRDVRCLDTTLARAPALTTLTHARYSQSPALQHRTLESLG
jgi:multidrug resistance efflux pump